MAQRIYCVGPTPGTGAEPIELVRLVRAESQAQAIRHVVRKRFTAEVASQEQLVELISVEGVIVENAVEDTVAEVK